MRVIIAGITLLAFGVAIFGYTLVMLISGAALDPQTKVPGTVTAELDSPGKYYVWDNHWTTFDGKRFKYNSGWPKNAKVVVHDSSGRELDFIPDESQNWSIGNNEKTSVGYIEVLAPTEIRLDIQDVGNERIVTISNRTMNQELWSRLSGLGLGLIVGAIGFPICLFGLFIRRRTSKVES